LNDAKKRGFDPKDGAVVARLNGDVNKVTNGSIYLGYCLSDKDAKTTNLIVSGKDTRYR
jgi:hypothetical protein